LYFSRKVIGMEKSRRIRWAELVARMEIRGMGVGFWWESQKEGDHYEDLDAGERIILKNGSHRNKMR
jgi:hypothetical protein